LNDPLPGKEPTPRELEILKVLWEQGPSSVRLVHDQIIAREPDLAFNTIQTMLRLMENKGLVDHVQDGRSFVYSARFSRDETAKRFLERVFDGVASQLVLSLLRSERVAGEELELMQKMIREAQQRNRSKGEGGGK
jgi:predicted transcriptional regulator